MLCYMLCYQFMEKKWDFFILFGVEISTLCYMLCYQFMEKKWDFFILFGVEISTLTWYGRGVSSKGFWHFQISLFS